MAKKKILIGKNMNDYMNKEFYELGPDGRKPHKFFERYLNNDLNDLANFLREKYAEIESGMYDRKNADTRKIWEESGSTSTVKWRDYNVFQFHHPAIYDVLRAVKDMVQEGCEYYGINYDEQRYMVQGWFNINKKGNGKLGWHEHGPGGAPNFHGYYAINAEPSVTHYKIYNNPNLIKDNVNINNRAVLSEMGHPHSQGDWEWEGDRITLAYDVVPLGPIRPDANNRVSEQHWMPLV